jgi:hypothetical protein
MTQSLISSDRQLEHTLGQAMEQFQPAGKQTAVLERFKAIVIGLKAKGATCLEIKTFLDEHGLSVAESAIFRFCRKYRVEVARMRSHGTAEAAPSSEPSVVPGSGSCSSVSTDPNPPTSQPPKMRSLRRSY